MFYRQKNHTLKAGNLPRPWQFFTSSSGLWHFQCLRNYITVFYVKLKKRIFCIKKKLQSNERFKNYIIDAYFYTCVSVYIFLLIEAKYIFKNASRLLNSNARKLFHSAHTSMFSTSKGSAMLIIIIFLFTNIASNIIN